MQRSNALLMTLIGAVWLGGQAEAGPIEQIRADYNRLTTEVERCLRRPGSEGSDCALYLVEVKDNALQRPVAAVGTSETRTRYWYDPSGFTGTASDPSLAGPGPLVRVEIRGQRAAVNWFEEYVYQDGALVFYFMKSDFGAFRFYFRNGALVDFVASRGASDSQDPSYVMGKSDWPQVLRRAACYRSAVPGAACAAGDRLKADTADSTHLCVSSRSSLPDDVRIREADLSNEEALNSLYFLESRILEPLLRAKGEAVVPWEMLNIGASNAAVTIRGALLRARAQALAEERRRHPERIPEAQVREAVEAYCKLLRESAMHD